MMLLQQLAECCRGDLKKRGVLYIYCLNYAEQAMCTYNTIFNRCR